MVWSPSSEAARNTRIAISLRLATRIRLMGAGMITSAVIMASCPPQRPTIVQAKRNRVRHLQPGRRIPKRWRRFHEFAGFIWRVAAPQAAVAGGPSRVKGNDTAETALRGWGGRTRTAESDGIEVRRC